MNLKGEIYLRIKQSFPDNNPNTITFVSTEIVKLIEKRIDELKMTGVSDRMYNYALEKVKEILK